MLLKDLKSVIYINEIINVYDEKNSRLTSVLIFYGKVKDIPQEFDNCVVCNVFINMNEELSIYIKKE